MFTGSNNSQEVADKKKSSKAKTQTSEAGNNFITFYSLNYCSLLKCLFIIEVVTRNMLDVQLVSAKLVV